MPHQEQHDELSSAVARIEACIPQIRQIMDTCRAPSATFGVIHKGQIIFERSIGYSNIEEKMLADSNTLYPIASCTKMFTSATHGLLVDEGKLRWQDRVQQYLPAFDPIGDPNIAGEVDVIDCLRHSVGLEDPTGISITIDGHNTTSREDVIPLLNFMETTNEKGQRFNRAWHYNNYTYGLAALILENITGQSFPDYLHARILEPLGMSRTSFLPSELDRNVATEYVALDEKDQLKPVPATRGNFDDNVVLQASMGLYSSLRDMLRWCMAVLDAERYEKTLEAIEKGSTEHVVGDSQNSGYSIEKNPLRQMRRVRRGYWTRPSDDPEFGGNTAYGMGWLLMDMPTNMLSSQSGNFHSREKPHRTHLQNVLGRDSDPFKVICHSGGSTGAITSVYTCPDTQSAIVVMTNSRVWGDATDFIAQILMQVLFDLRPTVDIRSWARLEADLVRKAYENMVRDWKANQQPEDPERDISVYAGRYKGYGGHFSLEISIDHNSRLSVIFNGHQVSSRTLVFYRKDTYSFFQPGGDIWPRWGTREYTGFLLEFQVDDRAERATGLTWGCYDEGQPVKFNRTG